MKQSLLRLKQSGDICQLIQRFFVAHQILTQGYVFKSLLSSFLNLSTEHYLNISMVLFEDHPNFTWTDPAKESEEQW